MISTIETYVSHYSSRIGSGFFLFVFLLFSSQGFGQDPASQTPTYDHLRSIDLINLSISFSGVNTEDIPISIDVDPQNNLYILTLGDGIEKRDSNGDLINANFISGLRSPLDFTIDDNGFFYVAEYSEDGSCNQNGKIKIYNPDGSFNRQIYTSFYRPLGIDVDQEGNIYVAEYNQPGNGCESDELSRVSIYNSVGSRIASESYFLRPYRIAVSSNKTVYLSQEGNGNPEVLILDQNLNITGSLPNITSPGSVVLDQFDFIHVVEYANRIDFSRFINFEELTLTEIQSIAREIDEGIDDNAFFIKVFDPTHNYEFQYQENLDFPVDIAFNECDRMYVNDGLVDGRNTFLGYIPERMEFDLDIFERTPVFDDDAPEISSCPPNNSFTIAEGQTTTEITYNAPTFSDANNFTIERTSGPASGTQQEEGVYDITYTATDVCGYKTECTFQITVIESEGANEPPTINCPANISQNTDPGECGAIVTYNLPQVNDDSDTGLEPILISGPSSGDFVDAGITTVRYRVTDSEGLESECSFTITVIDNEAPIIECPDNIVETVAFGETSKVVSYTVGFDDNCSGATIEQTAGIASGEEFPVGQTTNTFVVTDATGNTAECSFTVTITEGEDTEDPVISCPDNISVNNDAGQCGAVVSFSDATATDNSGETPTIVRTDDTGLNSGDEFPVGTTTISFRATDEAGNFSDCSFTITVTDNEDPTISCPEDLTETVAFGETFKLVNYSVDFDDNCPGATLEQTAGLASGEEFPVGETITNTFVVTDSSGMTTTCSFTVTVNEQEDTEAPEISCPENILQGTDSGQCRAIVNFPEVTATDNSGGEITITRIDNTEFDNGDYFPVGTTTLSYRATDEAGNSSECSFTVSIEDNEAPVISNCPAGNPSFTIQEGESHILDDYTTQVLVSDNCDENPLISQQPSPDTEITEDQEVVLRAIDEAGNESELCSFTVEINVEESYEFACIGNITVLLGGEAQNSSVTEIPTSEFITSDISNLDLELNVQQFTCDDIGTFDLEINASDKETGEAYSCTVQVTVEDVGAPLIICPAEPITLDLPENGYIVPDFFENRVTDNCNALEQLELVQDLEAGTILDSPGTYTINLTATDTYDNVETCEVTVILEEDDTTTPEITCPGKQTLDVGDDCEIALPDYTDLATTNPDMEVIQTPAPGTMITSTQQITFTAALNGETVTCDFELEVINPANNYSMTCPLTGVNIYEIGASEDGVIVNFDDPVVTGACGEVDIQQTGGPASGTLFSLGTYEISFTAIDDAGRQLDCSFEIVVINEEELSLSCPGEYEIFADENCQYLVPDFSEIVSFGPEDAIIEQSIEPGATTITNADPFITVTATYEGESVSCDIYLLLKDEIAPVVNCLADRTVEVEEGEIYTLPDFRNELDRSDNCGIAEITQQPVPGTELEEDTRIFLNITDEAGNTTQCDFLLSIREKGNIDFSCIIEEYELSPNQDCEYRMPDFSTILEYGPEDADFSQAISPGTILEEDTELQVSVSYEGETKTCNLYVSLGDELAPEAICVGQLDIVLEEGETRIITAAMIYNGSNDDCGEVSLSLDTSEFTAADEGDNTVILTVTDAAGNTATCESIVRVSISDSDINNPPVVIDDVYTTSINTQLNVSTTDGVLANDYDVDDDELSVRLDTDVQNGNLQLNEDGSFSYTPDPDFLGQDFFTYIASDGESDSNITYVSLYVIDDSSNFSCVDQVVLSLGPEGVASLDIANLYSGDSDGLEISISQQEFSCEHIGDNTVSLSYTGRLEGSCDITVRVIDNTPPVLNLRDISIDLNLEGVATINFQDVNDGSFDACDPNFTYVLSKNVFTCKEVGENLVRVTAEDASGNISTAMVSVTVFVEEGICSEVGGSDYIFLYPNPNSGEFQVATPGDINISRIEIFDNRGRFVTARNFNENDSEYSMQVEGLQEAIYILKLETNEGEVVKRMIFKR